MADDPWSRLAPLSTALAVDDVETASAFYQWLGFEQTMTLPRPEGGLAFAMLVLGTSALLLGPADDLHYRDETRTALFQRGPRGLGVSLVLDVPDVEAVYATVQDAGLDVIYDLSDEFYGERVFMFVDADGYEWKVCQRTEDVPPDVVEQRADPPA